MNKLASELEFISQIKRDGSGVTKVKKSYIKAMFENPLMKNELFELHHLSLSQKTYIAFNFNVFVVKIKDTV
jgi:hypothetical protein